MQKTDIDSCNVSKEMKNIEFFIAHDLRAPVVSSIGLMRVLKKAVENNKTDTAIDMIDEVEITLKNFLNTLEMLRDYGEA